VHRATQPLRQDFGSAVEPDGHPAAVQRPAVPRIDDGTTAGRHDPPDRGARFGRAEIGDGMPLERPKRRLAVLGEDRLDRTAVARLDALVEVDELGPMTRREPLPDHALAAPRQTDQHDVHGGT
jgi:hypothetical protein